MASNTTNPTIANATSVTILAAEANRRGLLIQNNSAADIMVNLEGGTLTGIVPTETNDGIVLDAGASFSAEGYGICPTGAITAYQTSGASINTVTVVSFT